MKSKLAPFTLTLAAVVLSLTALAQTGNAASAPSVPVAAGGTKIGIINMQVAIAASNEGQRDLSTLAKKFEPKDADFKNRKKEIDDLQAQLKTQGDKLNDDARATLVNSIQTKEKTLQRDSEDAQNDYQGQQNEIVQRILRKMFPILDKYAKDQGFALVMDVSQQWPQGQVLWAGPSIDITKAVVDEYNKESGVPAPAKTGAEAGGAPNAPSASKPVPHRAPTGGTTTPKH